MRLRLASAVTLMGAAMLSTIPAAAQSCVGSGNMSALTAPGVTWAFHLAGFNLPPPAPQVFAAAARPAVRRASALTGAAGTFRLRLGTDPRAVGAGQQGFVDSLITINLDGTAYTTLLPVSGKFQLDWGLNGECNSGTLLLASGTDPSTVRSVRFVLSVGNARMYLVSTDNDGVVLSGDAERQ